MQPASTCSYLNSQQHPSTFPSTYVAYPSTSSYPYQQPPQPPQQQQYGNSHSGNQYGNSYGTSHGNSYSQALTDYTANQYYQQQYQQSAISNKTKSNLKWNTKRRTPYGKPQGTGVSQDLYCEICKVNCAGEQSYKTHCDGQKHKKKELIMNNGSTPVPKARQPNLFFCELCQVPCNGVDSFNAHLNGKSHIKVCNLQAKLGKEIPLELVAPILKPTGQSTAQPISQAVVESPVSRTRSANIKVIGTPAINFVKGECLNTMADCEANESETQESAVDNSEQEQTANEQTNGQSDQTNGSIEPDESVAQSSAPANESAMDAQQDANSNNQISFIDEQDNAANQSNGEPVGLEFITEFNQANSKAAFFACTLCNCKFSEITAKEQHLRGKRHHRAFAKMGNTARPPNMNQTPVATPMGSIMPPYNASPSINQAPFSSSPLISQAPFSSSPLINQTPSFSPVTPMRKPPSFSNLLPSGPKTRPNKKQRTNDSFHYIAPDEQPKPASGEFRENMDIRSFIDCEFYETPHTSLDNRYLLRKHAEIVPREDDLKLFYRHIGNVEKSLKLVSDEFLQEVDGLRERLSLPAVDGGRILQGEIRAGLFGKKLLLRDEQQIDLILFCSVKPNVPLLRKVAEVLAAKLDLIEGEKYQVQENIEMAGIDVRASNATIRITLTSLYFRDMNVPAQQHREERFQDPEQMLNRQRCLDALTALRRFKWYLAKISPFQPCPLLIRLLKELTKRVPAWKPLTCWALELICERVLSNCTTQPSPEEGFKFILRTLAAGALLSDSYEAMLIQDPCEYEKVDALSYLSEEQRKAITDSAQDFVGLIAFNKMHQVLGVKRIDSGVLGNKTATSNGDAKTNETGGDEQKSSLDIGISEETADEPGAKPQEPTAGETQNEATSNDASKANDVDR